MTIDLAACLDHTMSYEGGWADIPGDPGGATNYGITLPTLRRMHPQAGVARLRALTPSDARAIYRALYYVPAGAENLAAGVNLMVGDMAVNAGVDRAAKILQQALGLTADGQVGPHTLHAAIGVDPVRLIVAMGVLQAAFYRGLPGFPQFGHGWLNRVRDRQMAALSMAGVRWGVAA